MIAGVMVEWFNTKAKQAERFSTGTGTAVPRGRRRRRHQGNWLVPVRRPSASRAGIGATNNSPVGKGARLGVRAQIQHLKAYANNEARVDPRGAAGNKWTGQSLVMVMALWEEMYNFCVEEEEEGNGRRTPG